MHHYFEWWGGVEVPCILKLATDEGVFKLHFTHGIQCKVVK